MFFSPLRPTACQSVRMDFLAVLPGVHSIDTLTLTDTESGFSMNLRYLFVFFFHLYSPLILKIRSVIDIVVHDSSNY